MIKPILIIFVDALPYDRAINIVNKLQSSTYKKTVPGVGYSINVKAELFSGLKPDDVGYFCEWNYDPDKVPAWYVNLCMSIFEFIGSKHKFIDRVFHRILKSILKENVYAIPYSILPLLKCSGLTAYERNFSRDTVLSVGGFDRVLYSEEGVNDSKVFDKALDFMSTKKCNRLFVSTAELDGIMHRYGMHCNEYEDQISLIEKYVPEIISKFIDINGEDAKYFVFSDHGMASVSEGVDFDIVSKFGKPGKASYIHFVDATFYRVWVLDASLKQKMLKEFNDFGHGHVLSDEERKTYGLLNKEHGDIIYMLDEAKQFAPSFFGNDICKAMHGYEPSLDSQHGAFISNINGEHGGYISAVDIYRTMKNSL